MEGVVHDTLIERGVEHHLPYAVCMEDGGGVVCDRALCGASPAICCMCIKWTVWCMILS